VSGAYSTRPLDTNDLGFISQLDRGVPKAESVIEIMIPRLVADGICSHFTGWLTCAGWSALARRPYLLGKK
jgi:hypothetical protein